MVHRALENLKKPDLLYASADIEKKREIIGLIYPEKWRFENWEHRTGKINEAVSLIYQINNKIRNKKSELSINKKTQFGKVHL